jgi:hypothetical protein
MPVVNLMLRDREIAVDVVGWVEDIKPIIVNPFVVTLQSIQFIAVGFDAKDGLSSRQDVIVSHPDVMTKAVASENGNMQSN